MPVFFYCSCVPEEDECAVLVLYWPPINLPMYVFLTSPLLCHIQYARATVSQWLYFDFLLTSTTISLPCVPHKNGCCLYCLSRGLSVDSLTVSAADEDECGDEDVCSQRCSNTAGSHTCSCVHGYIKPDADPSDCLPVNGENHRLSDRQR